MGPAIMIVRIDVLFVLTFLLCVPRWQEVRSFAPPTTTNNYEHNVCCVVTTRKHRINTAFGPIARKRDELKAGNQQDDNSFDLVEIENIEKQVYASAQEVMDRRLILEALEGNSELQDGGEEGSAVTTPAPQWKIALAAALAGSSLSFFISKSLAVSGIVLVVMFLAANADPLDDDSVGGALARLLGRVTIRSVEASQPKVKALARAVITGEEEIVALKERLRELEIENDDLRLWKERRIRVDESLSQYTLEALKEKARSQNLPVGGTKAQLLMRLEEADVMPPPSSPS